MKLSKKKINETMQEFAHLKVQIDKLSEQLEEKEALLKKYMASNQIEELVGDEYKAIYKLIHSNKINVKALKEERPNIYERYLVDNSYMRFTLSVKPKKEVNYGKKS